MLEDPENPAWYDVSVEFCGGTHLSNTSQAESFALLEEVTINIFSIQCSIPLPCIQETTLILYLIQGISCGQWSVLHNCWKSFDESDNTINVNYIKRRKDKHHGQR